MQQVRNSQLLWMLSIEILTVEKLKGAGGKTPPLNFLKIQLLIS